MTWKELATLVAMVLGSGTVLSILFQQLKARIPEKWRSLVLSAVCLLVAVAEQWLLGNVLGIVGDLSAGVATAAEVFTFGSATFGLTQIVYEKWVRPKGLVDKPS